MISEQMQTLAAQAIWPHADAVFAMSEPDRELLFACLIAVIRTVDLDWQGMERRRLSRPWGRRFRYRRWMRVAW